MEIQYIKALTIGNCDANQKTMDAHYGAVEDIIYILREYIFIGPADDVCLN